jgi:predicted  nucleic acid-binding Zn-ribbon protein
MDDARSVELARKSIAMERDRLSQKEQALKKNVDDIAELRQKIEGLQEQLKSPFTKTLSAQQERDMQRLQEQNTKLKKTLTEKSNARAKVCGIADTIRAILALPR